MWAKKILLLSCLYPIIFLVLMGYMYLYTVYKPVHSSSAQKSNFSFNAFTFLSPVPTTITVQNPGLQTTKITIPVTPTKEIASPSATPSIINTQNIASESSSKEQNSVIVVDEAKPIVSPTVIPSKQQLQQIIQSKSVVIMERATSSAVNNFSGSYIIEKETATQTTSSLRNQPRACAKDEFC